MARYYFDIHDSGAFFDDIGSELPDLLSVRKEALAALPAIAAEQIPLGEDRRHFTVLVKDENATPIYSATLTFTGIWLTKPPTKV